MAVAALKPELVVMHDDMLLRHGNEDLAKCPWKSEYSCLRFIVES
jgi:hypothetical protein